MSKVIKLDNLKLEKFRDKKGYIVADELKIKEDKYGVICGTLNNVEIFFKASLLDTYSHYNEVLISVLSRQFNNFNLPFMRYDLARTTATHF